MKTIQSYLRFLILSLCTFTLINYQTLELKAEELETVNAQGIYKRVLGKYTYDYYSRALNSVAKSVNKNGMSFDLLLSENIPQKEAWSNFAAENQKLKPSLEKLKLLKYEDGYRLKIPGLDMIFTPGLLAQKKISINGTHLDVGDMNPKNIQLSIEKLLSKKKLTFLNLFISDAYATPLHLALIVGIAVIALGITVGPLIMNIWDAGQNLIDGMRGGREADIRIVRRSIRMAKRNCNSDRNSFNGVLGSGLFATTEPGNQSTYKFLMEMVNETDSSWQRLGNGRISRQIRQDMLGSNSCEFPEDICENIQALANCLQGYHTYVTQNVIEPAQDDSHRDFDYKSGRVIENRRGRSTN